MRELQPVPVDATSTLLAELNKLDEALSNLAANPETHAALTQRLAAFTRKWSAPTPENGIEAALSSADDNDLYAMIDRSLAQ
jgi:hypothetical protein